MLKKLLVVLCVVLMITGCNNDIDEDDISDAIKFKQEYENHNNQINKDNGMAYTNLVIEEDNPMIYATFEQIMEVLDSDGIIYFGFETCPWCRSAVPVILDAAKASNVSSIYYFNALDLRDIKELDSDGNINTEKECDPKYYELLDKIGSIAEPYTGLNDESIKRLYFPTVVVVKDQEIVFYHTSTVESQSDPYQPLNDQQYEELFNLYKEAFAQVSIACRIDKC